MSKFNILAQRPILLPDGEAPTIWAILTHPLSAFYPDAMHGYAYKLLARMGKNCEIYSCLQHKIRDLRFQILSTSLKMLTLQVNKPWKPKKDNLAQKSFHGLHTLNFNKERYGFLPQQAIR